MPILVHAARGLGWGGYARSCPDWAMRSKKTGSVDALFVSDASDSRGTLPGVFCENQPVDGSSRTLRFPKGYCLTV